MMGTRAASPSHRPGSPDAAPGHVLYPLVPAHHRSTKKGTQAFGGHQASAPPRLCFRMLPTLISGPAVTTHAGGLLPEANTRASKQRRSIICIATMFHACMNDTAVQNSAQSRAAGDAHRAIFKPERSNEAPVEERCLEIWRRRLQSI